jgi:hypothetical protein
MLTNLVKGQWFHRCTRQHRLLAGERPGHATSPSSPTTGCIATWPPWPCCCSTTTTRHRGIGRTGQRHTAPGSGDTCCHPACAASVHRAAGLRRPITPPPAQASSQPAQAARPHRRTCALQGGRRAYKSEPPEGAGRRARPPLGVCTASPYHALLLGAACARSIVPQQQPEGPAAAPGAAPRVAARQAAATAGSASGCAAAPEQRQPPHAPASTSIQPCHAHATVHLGRYRCIPIQLPDTIA